MNSIRLLWGENAHGVAYDLQISDNAREWQTIHTEEEGLGGEESFDVDAEGRYVRMYGRSMYTQWGFSLFEFEVWGGPLG